MSRHALVVCIAILLTGCAGAARVESMVGAPTAQLVAASPLRQGVRVNSVLGGTATNPLWTSEIGNPEFQQALEQSLRAQGMLAEDGGRYHLNVNLMEIRQPFIGLNFTVTSTIRYTLVETVANRIAFEQTITADYTAGVGDAFIAVERLRLANEGSAKANISKFLDALIQSPEGRGGAAVRSISIGGTG